MKHRNFTCICNISKYSTKFKAIFFIQVSLVSGTKLLKWNEKQLNTTIAKGMLLLVSLIGF